MNQPLAHKETGLCMTDFAALELLLRSHRLATAKMRIHEFYSQPQYWAMREFDFLGWH